MGCNMAAGGVFFCLFGCLNCLCFLCRRNRCRVGFHSAPDYRFHPKKLPPAAQTGVAVRSLLLYGMLLVLVLFHLPGKPAVHRQVPGKFRVEAGGQHIVLSGGHRMAVDPADHLGLIPH